MDGPPTLRREARSRLGIRVRRARRTRGLVFAACHTPPPRTQTGVPGGAVTWRPRRLSRALARSTAPALSRCCCSGSPLRPVAARRSAPSWLSTLYSEAGSLGPSAWERYVTVTQHLLALALAQNFAHNASKSWWSRAQGLHGLLRVWERRGISFSRGVPFAGGTGRQST